VILPGKTIGLVGGGQLGRMFAIAARRMGYRVHTLDPTGDCPAGQVADLEVTAAYDDLAAAMRFAQGVDVVSFEFENVPSQTLAAIEKIRPVHPSPFILETTRHRIREKDFLSANAFPVAPYRAVRNLEELRRAIGELGTPCILKTAEFGYDGKGQSRIESLNEAADAWAALNCPVGVLEGLVKFDQEISVIVARNEQGETRTFDVFENVHVHHILDTTICPANVSDPIASRARDLAHAIAEKLKLVGLLCVEMFVVGQEPIVNELAPRPHNSGHVTFDACVTSQFEQQLRAVCGLPLGDTALLRPVAMANLLGDVWLANQGAPPWDQALRDPRSKLHLYGKTEAKHARKMGHLTAMAHSTDAARDAVLAARAALLPKP